MLQRASLSWDKALSSFIGQTFWKKGSIERKTVLDWYNRWER